MHKNHYINTSIIVSTLLLSSQVYAAGFQLNEHSAAGLGRAFAGEAAIADTAAVGNRNPAAMTLFKRPAISVGVTYVNPQVNIDGTSPSGNSLHADDIAPSEFIPNFSYVHPINDSFALGVFGSSFYGLSTKFDEQYPAGMLGGSTKLITGNLNLASAYRANEHLSFGLGVNVAYGKPKLVRHAGEMSNALPFPSETKIAHLSGDAWGLGWNVGLLYEINEKHRFALSYRSKVKFNFKGDYYSQLPPSLVQPGLPQGTGGLIIPGKLKLDMPEIWELSMWHQVAPKWAVHYGFTYTGWDSFKELSGVSQGDGGVLFHKTEGFKNSIRMAIGTTYQHSDKLAFRAGLAYDDSAVPQNNHSISIPDQDRTWISMGTTYAFTPSTSIDLGAAYMKGSKVTFNEAPYTFDANGTAWLYAVNFNYTF